TAPVQNAGAQINNTVTVNAHDDENDAASTSASDSITYQDVRSEERRVENETGTINEGTSGKTISYHFTVTNTSTASTDPVTETSLSDTVLGNLLPAFEAANGGSDVIAFGGHVSFDATYTAPVQNAGAQINNTVTVNAHDDENDAASSSASDSITYQDV